MFIRYLDTVELEYWRNSKTMQAISNWILPALNLSVACILFSLLNGDTASKFWDVQNHACFYPNFINIWEFFN